MGLWRKIGGGKAYVLWFFISKDIGYNYFLTMRLLGSIFKTTALPALNGKKVHGSFADERTLLDYIRFNIIIEDKIVKHPMKPMAQ